MVHSIELISDEYKIEELCLQDLGPAVIEAWAALEEKALEPNAYLSPHFVLPALRYLDPGLNPMFVAVWAVGQGQNELVGLGVFVLRGPSRHLPLRRLSAYASHHSYISGLLVHNQRVVPVLSHFLAFFLKKGAAWQCVEFADSRLDAPQMLAFEKLAISAGLTLDKRGEFKRAVFNPAITGSGYPVTKHSRRRLKELHRLRRRLDDHGVLSGRLLNGTDIETVSSATRRFAVLENMGWKGNEATSFLSDPAEQAFLFSLTENFACAGRIFFTELVLNGVPIASTCNLISGNAGFAFKIGWNPEYSRFSPGKLLELWFVERADAMPLNLVEIDSGTREGSFIDSFWSGRKTMASVVLPTTSTARAVLALQRALHCRKT